MFHHAQTPKGDCLGIAPLLRLDAGVCPMCRAPLAPPPVPEDSGAWWVGIDTQHYVIRVDADAADAADAGPR
jgi:hypothetical protein